MLQVAEDLKKKKRGEYKNMITLRLGKMSSKEIAEWMGITYGTYKNSSQKRLEYLKNFAKFTPCYGGVMIEEIYLDTFVKNISEDDKVYVNEIKQCNEGLSTVAGMIRKLKLKNEEYKDISEDTLYKRMSKAGDRAFGRTIEQDSKGTCGSRHYVWAVRIDKYNHYRRMTEEEEVIYKQLLNEYCDDEKKQEQIEKDALVLDAFKNHEITAEEYAEYKLYSCNFFTEVVGKFKSRTGFLLVRTTKHELDRIEEEANN